MNTFARAMATCLIVLCFTAAAAAATFVVNTNSDSLDANLGNGACADMSSNCSLRAAIMEANSLPGADVISLAAATYTQTLFVMDDNANTGGDWDITSEITINGVHQSVTILQTKPSAGCANVNDRVIDVGVAGKLTLTNATVRNGCAYGQSPRPGAGITNFGALTLIDVIVRDNEVKAFEGSGSGGGIFNGGPAVTLINTTVTANLVMNGLLGISYGAGMLSDATATIVITNSSISGNTVDSFGLRALGGGLMLFGSYSLTATDSHFDNNVINGELGGNAGGGLYASGGAGSALNFNNCTFNNNSVTGTGSATGIGILLETNGSSGNTLNATFDRVTINGNTGNGGAGTGVNAQVTGGPLTLSFRSSTISNNSGAANGGGFFLSNNGGGPASVVTASFSNSTLSGNTAVNGGGLSNQQGTAPLSVTFNFSTIYNNTASANGGGLHNPGAGGISIGNTIVAGNNSGGAPDIFQTVNSFNYNHIGNTGGAIFTGTTTNNTGGDPALGPLRDNGGATFTHFPASSFTVVNSIPLGQNGCSSAPNNVDQRGVARPVGGACDKGAVERNGPFSISGSVLTAGGIPIRNTVVRLEGSNLAAPLSFVTGNFGLYQFSGLAPGHYTVFVKTRRFTFANDIELLDLQQNATVDFVAQAEARGSGQSVSSQQSAVSSQQSAVSGER